jgi:hypothetical protein
MGLFRWIFWVKEMAYILEVYGSIDCGFSLMFFGLEGWEIFTVIPSVYSRWVVLDERDGCRMGLVLVVYPVRLDRVFEWGGVM